MKIWSKGLGSMTLKMDFRNYYAEINNEGQLQIKGKITDPVLWNFVITVNREDIIGLTNIFFKPGTLKYFAKNSLKIPQFFFDKICKREKFVHPEKNIQIVKQ